MNPIIKVENLSKRYILNRNLTSPDTLRESVVEMIRTPFKRLRDPHSSSGETLWALKEINLKVMPGEVVGIIGRNGAGKSTLLKVLSRIVEPTAGRIALYGRVGSLLEVGTGFHPELSGRENVFLNGAILGMKKAEVERKFDEIVAFAELERFIDMPVKRYSSGMHVRLAFAVAAHLESEIVILDEVLAVGDAKFQKKCITKMDEINSAGRTVLFVSHNVHAIARSCKRTILIKDGQIVADDASSTVIAQYMASDRVVKASRKWDVLEESPGNEIVRLRSIRVCDKLGNTAEHLEVDEPIGIELVYDVLEHGNNLSPNLHFYNEEGEMQFVANDLDPTWTTKPKQCGRYVTTAWLPQDLLNEGTVIIGAAISTPHPFIEHFIGRDLVSFQTVESTTGGGVRGDYDGAFPGFIRPRLAWQTEYHGEMSQV
jgi:lipopolysaccharide transport system ATP-binding protein